MSISKKKQVELKPEFFGEKTCIISKSGYGKSYTSRVIIEEGIKKGVTFIVLDPQDAYLNLQGFDYIEAQNVKSAKALGILLSQTNKNIIIRTKKLGIDDQNLFVAAFLTEFRKHIRKGIQTIVIDEIHKFAPETEKSKSKEIIRGMFQENRSDGVGCIAITQRISRLDKTILSQADNLALGRVTSFRDKEAVKNYIDDPEDIEKIKELKKGEFYLYGFGLEKPEIVTIREAESQHSGDSPKNLLTEDTNLYNKHINKIVKKRQTGEKNMSEEIKTGGEVVKKVIPSFDGFLDLAMLGFKVGLGSAVGGLAGTLIGSRVPSPIPYVSSRTLGGAASMVALYAGYRMTPESFMSGVPKDMLKYGAAGAAVYTAGSAVYDALGAFNIRLPNIVNFLIATGSGASPVMVGAAKSEGGEEVDTDTAMG